MNSLSKFAHVFLNSSTSICSSKSSPNELELKAKIYKVGQLQVFKREENTALEIEPGDFITGIVENTFIQALYLGGDVTKLVSYKLMNQLEF